MISSKTIVLSVISVVMCLGVIVIIQFAEINNKKAILDELKSTYQKLENDVENTYNQLDLVKSDEWQILAARKKGWGFPNERRYVAK